MLFFNLNRVFGDFIFEMYISFQKTSSKKSIQVMVVLEERVDFSIRYYTGSLDFAILPAIKRGFSGKRSMRSYQSTCFSIYSTFRPMSFSGYNNKNIEQVVRTLIAFHPPRASSSDMSVPMQTQKNKLKSSAPPRKNNNDRYYDNSSQPRGRVRFGKDSAP